MRLRRTILAAACAAATIGVTACGSDDETSSTSTAAEGAAATATQAANAPKGDPIVVGFLCSCSGVQSPVIGLTDDAAKAWAADVNARGGVNGHPVKLVVKDDAGDPAKALQAAKELVEQEGVVAIVGQTTNPQGGMEKYVSSKGVPVIGGLPQSAPNITNPLWFPTGSSLPVNSVANMQLAKKAGKKKVGVLYCAESPVCAQLDPITKAAAGLVGGLDYQSGKISATAPNYTAPCTANKQAGVDALYVAHNTEVVVRVVDACAKLGYKPLILANPVSASQAWLDSGNFDGAQLASANAPLEDEANPGIKTFLGVLDQYAPELRKSPQFNVATLYPYAGGKLFEAAATKAKLTPTSKPADLIEGLYGLKDETLDGISPPLNYTKGKPAFPACSFTVAIEDGKFSAPNGSEPNCLTAEQATQLAGALAG